MFSSKKNFFRAVALLVTTAAIFLVPISASYGYDMISPSNPASPVSPLNPANPASPTNPANLENQNETTSSFEWALTFLLIGVVAVTVTVFIVMIWRDW